MEIFGRGRCIAHLQDALYRWFVIYEILVLKLEIKYGM